MSRYVVLEYNQASHQPEVFSDLCWTEQDARDIAEEAKVQSRAIGRLETYAVAEIVLVDDEESS
jgi:hypothetical protein